MSAVNRSLRTASKQLRTVRLGAAAPLVSSSAARSSASIGVVARSISCSKIPSSYSNFSTTVARNSGAPAMASAPREYDPEIKDIADYVANKKIDSELAVSPPWTPVGLALPRAHNKLHTSTPPTPSQLTTSA